METRRVEIPEAWHQKNPREMAKLGLLWMMWAGALLLMRALVATGGAGIAAAVAVGALTGVLVVAGIGFIGHDVCHGTVVAENWKMRLLAFFSLTMALFLPYFLWIRWHNAFHHRYANTRKDSDRLLREEERDGGLVSYPLYAAANRLGFSLQYVGLRMWNIIYGRKTLADWKKRSDVLTLALAVAIYAAIGVVVGPVVFAIGIVLPLISAAVVVSYYIQSNHFLRPQTAEVETIAGSMDVQVPAVVDFLHSNFSAHTAHHLFPAVPSKHYPIIRAQIEKAYAAEYRRMGWAQACWLNFSLPKVVREGKMLVDGRGKIRAELY